MIYKFKNNDTHHDMVETIHSVFTDKIKIFADSEFLRDNAPIFVANHQVLIESLIFHVIFKNKIWGKLCILAKSGHPLDKFVAILDEINPGLRTTPKMFCIKREDPLSVVREIHDHLDIIKDSSLLVHVAGTRSFVSDDPVTAMSYLFIELAISLDKPIVPVYFSGGLPVVNETKGRFDLPYQCTKQDVTIGNPILPNDFLSLSHSERKKLVLDSLNNLAPNDPSPNQPNPELVCAIQSIKSEFKVDELKAVLIYSILNAKDPHEDTLLLCEMLKNPDCFDRQTYGDFFKMVDYLRRSAE